MGLLFIYIMVFPSNWLHFHQTPCSLLAQWWKFNDACCIDFCKTSWRMLSKLGLKLTTPGLTACFITEWAISDQLTQNKQFHLLSQLIFYCINPVPHTTNLQQTTVKNIQGKTWKILTKEGIITEKSLNIVVKGEIDCYEQFLLFSPCFQIRFWYQVKG